MSNRTRDKNSDGPPVVAGSALVIRDLERSLPVDDLMAWLIRALPLADRDQVFSVLKVVYEAGFEIGSASPAARAYQIGQDTFRACPQRVTARRAR